MNRVFQKNSQLATDLGAPGLNFLLYGFEAILRILPHVEIYDLMRCPYQKDGCIKWMTNRRRELKFILPIQVGRGHSIEGKIRRRVAPAGIGKIQRTLDSTERSIAAHALHLMWRIVGEPSEKGSQTLKALHATFDERVVSAHLQSELDVVLDPAVLFEMLRTLAAQTYENKPLTFGCLVNTWDDTEPLLDRAFPKSFFKHKKYRALSDGFHTAYQISTTGALTGFIDLKNIGPTPGRVFHPNWCKNLAQRARDGAIGICLARSGDILVMAERKLRFTCRFGKWQYWNHGHLIDLLHGLTRVKKVSRNTTAAVATVIYRAALDVSFRRTGGLFVILGSERHLNSLVRRADRFHSLYRSDIDAEFDRSLPARNVLKIPRDVLVDIAGLDGAVVVGSTGNLLAFGAVLEPKKKGRTDEAEGSRTKAAIGASHYGLAIKISADGDIVVYSKGKAFIRV